MGNPREYETVTINLSGKVRQVVEDGKKYLVAPASILVGGQVLNGSKGALLYPPEECAKNPGVWNKIPLVLNHPTDSSGRNIAAHDPDGTLNSEVWDRYGLGEVRNDNWDGKRRHVEAWFDQDKTLNVSPEVHERLLNGLPLELSTGLFTDNQAVANGSQASGKPYTHIALNYRPDHLAILPHQVGACSLDMGCGVNNADHCPISVTYNRDWPQSKRDETPSGDFAGPDQSFPIATQTDVSAAAHLVGKAADPENVKSRIKTIAKQKGLTVPDSWEATTNSNPEGYNQYTGPNGAKSEVSDEIKGLSRVDHATKMKEMGLSTGYVVPAGDRTFDKKEDLKKAGGEWHAAGKRWLVPFRGLGKGQPNEPLVKRANHESHPAWINWKTHETYPHWTSLHSEPTGNVVTRLLGKIAEKLGIAGDKSNADALESLAVNYGGDMYGSQDKMGCTKTAAMMSMGDRKAREPAMAALDSANGGDSKSAAKSHIETAKIHEDSATKARKYDRPESADMNDQAAAMHRKAASLHQATVTANTQQEPEMDRKQTIQHLTTNCDCWKGDEKTLNTFDDAKLTKIKAQYDLASEGKAVLNAVRETIGAPELTVNAMPAALKAAVKKKDEEDSSVVEPTGNLNDQPLAELLKNRPADLAVWNTVVEAADEHKRKLVDLVVTANASTPEAQKLIRPSFDKLSVKELKTIIAGLPGHARPNLTGNQSQDSSINDYLGLGGGGFVGNRYSDEGQIDPNAILEVNYDAK